MKKTLHKLTSCILAVSLVAVSAPVLPTPGTDTAKAASGEMTNSPARVSVHDPSIAEAVDGTYYAFGTHIEAAKTTDFINWERFTNGYTTPGNIIFGDLSKNLQMPFAWAGENDGDCTGGYGVWAPDVFYNPEYVNEDGSKGTYMMYFSTSSTAVRSAIAFGVSKEIEGPYKCVDTLIYSGFTKEKASDTLSKIDKKYTNTNIDELIEAGILDDVSENWFAGSNGYDSSKCPNAIDPTVYSDTEGKLWMTYGSWSGGIFTLQIDPATGRAIYPGKDDTKEVTGDDGKTYTLRIDKYFGTQIAGGYTQSGEGPYILYDKESGYYYLYMTYEWLGADGGYNMRLFRSKNPNGPFLDAAGHHAVLSENSFTEHINAGIKVMGNYKFSANSAGYRAPGHNSALIDEDGSRYLFYHTRFADNDYLHELRVHQQFLNEDNWPVTAVFENMGDKISETGYSTDEIVGVYEFINHDIAANKDIVKTPESIKLNADSTISGAVTGKWEEKENSYLATFVLDGVTYKGVFFKQYDEQLKRQQVMTFTAIGTNNMTVWGVKDDMFHIKSSKNVLYTKGDTGNTAQITISSSNYNPKDYTVTYSSSEPSVAKVDETGKVTAVSADGAFTTITATVVCNGVTQELELDIDVNEASISYSSKKTSLKAKKSATFKVKTKGIKASSVKWKSSKPAVATVSKSGKVTAKKAGTAKITAYYSKNSKIKATVTLKVKK